MDITTKRIYEQADSSDGFRVLVDRLWPRGVSKESAKLDIWLKDVAPSPELREWFGHKPERFKEFTKLYHTELDRNSVLKELKELVDQHKKVTLLYGAKDPKINHAAVLKNYLESSK
jgi:uncharacterized protein YeaO (DUF488 family)